MIIFFRLSRIISIVARILVVLYSLGLHHSLYIDSYIARLTSLVLHRSSYIASYIDRLTSLFSPRAASSSAPFQTVVGIKCGSSLLNAGAI